jgi:hypothetical protein
MQLNIVKLSLYSHNQECIIEREGGGSLCTPAITKKGVQCILHVETDRLYFTTAKSFSGIFPYILTTALGEYRQNS